MSQPNHPTFDPGLSGEQLKIAVTAHYGARIDRSFWLARETLIKDLCNLHAQRSCGKDLPVPDEVVIKEITIPLA